MADEEKNPSIDESLDEEEEEEKEEDTDNIPPKNDNEVFAKFERDFNKMIYATEEMPELNRFMVNYTKLFNYVCQTRQKSMDQEDYRLELEEALRFNEGCLNDSMLIIKDDEMQIESLKGEIATSSRLIDNAHSREEAAQEVIDTLRKTIANLNSDIDMKNKMAQAELEENPAAAKHRENLEREKTKLISEVSKLSEKLNNALAYQEELERRTSLTDMRITDISTQLEETQAAVAKYKRNREKLESDIIENAEEVEMKSANVEVLRERMDVNEKLIHRYEVQLKDQTLAAQKCLKELEMWSKKFGRIQNTYNNLNVQSEILRKENAQAIKDLRAKDEKRIRLQIEVNKLTKEREQIDHKNRTIEIDKLELLDDKEKLKQVVSSMEKDFEYQKEETARNKELIEEHIKEKEILNRNLLRQQAVSRDHQKVIRIQEQTRKRLDHELDQHVIEIRRQDKLIMNLEKERDRLIEESLEKTKKIENTVEEISLQNKHLQSLQQMLTVNEAKYKFKQGLFDAVRADRNALQKEMQQCDAENNDMKEKLKINHRQSEQLKEGIGAKDVELNKEETIKRKIVKEKENIKIELNNSLDWIASLKQDVAESITEENRLTKVIDASEKLTKEQTKTIKELITERDVLGSQLVRRNDEISLVLEKIELIRQSLYAGEAQYEARLDDIKLLKVEIKRLRQEAFLLRRTIGNMTECKIEVFHLERTLAQERMKSRALEDELHNPMNVNRWRRLSGSDPEMSELLQKTAQLQKRLLSQAIAHIKVEKELKECENLYLNLRNLISHQPGAKVQTELNKAQKALFANTIKNKCLVSEVNMLEINNRRCNKNLEHALTQLNDVQLQLQHEKSLHTHEQKIVGEAGKLIEKMNAAVKMPPMKKGGDVTKAVTVSALSIAK